jgi:hypothetical protein
VHHIIFRTNGGGDAPSNLITLCKTCHDLLHGGAFQIKGTRSRTKHPTEIGIIKASLAKVWNFEPTFGYETKYRRERCLGWAKSHAADAVAIAARTGKSFSQRLASTLSATSLKAIISKPAGGAASSGSRRGNYSAFESLT